MTPLRCERCGKPAELDLDLSCFRYACSTCLVDGICVDCQAGLERCGCGRGCVRCGLSSRAFAPHPVVEVNG